MPGARPYPYNLLVDGNDSRGIDVGILSRFPVRSVRSHIFDGTEKGGDPVFSRDCPEFEIELRAGIPCGSSATTSRARASARPRRTARSV